jgi:hypothetical protein
VATVAPPTSTTAATARAVQDMPRGPLARRKLSLINAHRPFLRKFRPQPGTTYTAWCGVHRRAGWVLRGREKTGAAAALGVTATAPGLSPSRAKEGLRETWRLFPVPFTTDAGTCRFNNFARDFTR